MKRQKPEDRAYAGFHEMMDALSDLAKRDPGWAARIALARAETMMNVARSWVAQLENQQRRTE